MSALQPFDTRTHGIHCNSTAVREGDHKYERQFALTSTSIAAESVFASVATNLHLLSGLASEPLSQSAATVCSAAGASSSGSMPFSNE